jgi:hypothetical protein
MNDDERVLESFFSYYQDSKRMRAACQERMLENDDVNFIKYLYKKGETREFFDGLFYDACYTRKFKIVKFCLENGLSHIRDKTQLSIKWFLDNSSVISKLSLFWYKLQRKYVFSESDVKFIELFCAYGYTVTLEDYLFVQKLGHTKVKSLFEKNNITIDTFLSDDICDDSLDLECALVSGQVDRVELVLTNIVNQGYHSGSIDYDKLVTLLSLKETSFDRYVLTDIIYNFTQSFRLGAKLEDNSQLCHYLYNVENQAIEKEDFDFFKKVKVMYEDDRFLRLFKIFYNVLRDARKNAIEYLDTSAKKLTLQLYTDKFERMLIAALERGKPKMVECLFNEMSESFYSTIRILENRGEYVEDIVTNFQTYTLSPDVLTQSAFAGGNLECIQFIQKLDGKSLEDARNNIDLFYTAYNSGNVESIKLLWNRQKCVFFQIKKNHIDCVTYLISVKFLNKTKALKVTLNEDNLDVFRYLIDHYNLSLTEDLAAIVIARKAIKCLKYVLQQMSTISEMLRVKLLKVFNRCTFEYKDYNRNSLPFEQVIKDAKAGRPVYKYYYLSHLEDEF